MHILHMNDGRIVPCESYVAAAKYVKDAGLIISDKHAFDDWIVFRVVDVEGNVKGLILHYIG